MLLRKLGNLIRSVFKWLISWFKRKLPNLASPFVISIKERFSMSREPDVLIYTLNLGPYDGDVEVRQVTIEVSGVDEVRVVDVNVGDNTVEVSGFEDAKASLKIVDIDNKGNKAPAVVFDIILADTVSPQPGAVVTVVAVREIAGKKVVPPTEPVVEAPVVVEPVVEAPVVVEPVVEAPVVEAPVVEAPVVEAPVVEAPVVEAPVVEEPAVEAPVVEAPVVEEPAVEDPVVTAKVKKPKKK